MESENYPHIKKIWVYLLLQMVIVLLAIAVGVFGYRFLFQYRGELELLRQARDILIENSIYDIPEETLLEYGMIRGMLTTIEDPYTIFVEPAVHEIQSDDLTGSYGGIGVRLARDTAMNWRLYPLPDSPASEAGVVDGDILLQVADQGVTPDVDEITLMSIMRGPVGEKIEIQIQRNGSFLVFSIVRQEVPLPSADWNILPEAPQIGMIHVYRIAGTTTEEIQQGIEELTGLGVQGFILDLRDNGGGLVEAGLDIANLFLAEGETIRRQFKDEEIETFEIKKPGPFPDLPLVILINENTASSAEIVAGTLKSHQRAILIGRPTFGKTTIQFVFELQDGSSVHVTSGRWWIPGQAFPLQPDTLVGDDPMGTIILEEAIKVLQRIIQ